MNKKITIQEIQEAIKENSHNDDHIQCIYSDDNAQDVVMRIRIKQEPTEDFLDSMRKFEKELIELSLRGIKDIEKVLLEESNIIKYNLDGSIQPSKEWILETNGSNLLEILSNDYIDVERTITNDILEFHEIFGIEATRELIFRELMKLFANKHPNPRHIQMLADVMSYRGILMQIERHGMNKNPEIGPIAKASFEEVMNILTNSAVFAESDNMKGVSSNILAGQFCKNGTNSFNILIDEEKLIEDVPDSDYLYNDIQDVTSENVENIMRDVYDERNDINQVNDDDFNFGFGIENKEEYTLDKSKDLKLKIGEMEENMTPLNVPDLELEEIPNDEDDIINELELEEIPTENTNIDSLELEDIPTEDIEVVEEVKEKPKRGRKKKTT